MTRTRTRCASRARALTIFSLIAIFALVVASGCASSGKGKARASKKDSGEAAMPSGGDPKNTRHASYGVTWTAGDKTGDGTYRMAYVVQDGAPTVIESESDGFRTDASSDKAADTIRGEKIKNYLLMGPIRSIIGNRTTFEVGQTYNGVAMEGGRALFTYSCDREEEIAGIKGQRLTIKAGKNATPELEVVLSPQYPFPLYVKEHTGTEPLQIFLKDSQ
ncbi:MAG: hypothetical protein ACKVU1_02195 [bacterium]